MDSKDKSGKVYALFPGIDTTPFGGSPVTVEPGDDGWSTVPERTIAGDVPPGTSGGASASAVVDPAESHRSIRRAVSLATAVVAIVIGAGFAAAHALLAEPASKSPAASAHRGRRPAGIVAAVRHPRVARSVRSHTTRRASRKHHLRPKTGATGAHHTSRTSAATTVAGPVQTPPVEASAAEPTSSSSSPTGSSSGSRKSSGGRRPGPTGRVALIGAGTTPSG